MSADRLRTTGRHMRAPGPGYAAPGGVRRNILRRGAMAVCHLPAVVDRCVCAWVASYGIGGIVPSGDERGGVVVPGSGRSAAGSDMSLPFAVGGRRIAIGRCRVLGCRGT